MLPAAAVERASESMALDIVAVLAGAALSDERWRRIREFSPDLYRELTSTHGLCGSPALRDVMTLARDKGWRETTLLRLLTVGDPTAPWFVHETDHFRVSYQTAGSSAVPPDTRAADVIDPGSDPPVVVGHLEGGGMPTYVRRVAFWLERAFALYVRPPFAFQDPTSGGADKVDVLLGPFCLGFTAQSPPPRQMIGLDANANPGLVCALAAHEVFHAFQYAHAVRGDGWFDALVEGGAVFAEDFAADHINRYIHEAGPAHFNGPGILAEPGLPLATRSHQYKSSLLWRYLAEQYGSPEAYRRIWEEHATAVPIEDSVRALFNREFCAFTYVGGGRGGDLLSGDTLFGNYALACRLKDVAGCTDARFRFEEHDETVHFAELIDHEPPQSAMVRVRMTPMPVGPGLPPVNVTLSAFSHALYTIDVPSSLGAIDIGLTAVAAAAHIFQVVTLDTAGGVRDIIRSDAPTYTRRIPCGSLASITVIITSTSTGGDFTLTVAAAAASPLVGITRWNCAEGTSHETDSRERPWTMTSPDLWIDGGAGRWTIVDGVDNVVAVRLRNMGGAAARAVSVDFAWQPANAALEAGGWLPMLDATGTPARLEALEVPGGQSRCATASWRPRLPAGITRVCVRAVVTAPGDPNTDDKRALSVLTVSAPWYLHWLWKLFPVRIIALRRRIRA